MTYSTIADIIECYENKWTWVAIEYSAMKEVNQLVKNNAELLEALQAIAAMEPIIETYQGNQFCYFCGFDAEIDEGHAEGCAWMKAKAVTKATPTCNHSWMVFSTAVATGQIMVECELCEATGTVDAHTRAEWQAAFYAPSNPYRWDGGDDRITVRVGKVESE